MEFKGTKGKWEINTETESRIAMLNGGIDVWAFDNDRDFDNEEAKANAQLISKAPEMLEMLNKVLDHLTPEFPESSQELLLDEIKQLIKEATTI